MERISLLTSKNICTIQFLFIQKYIQFNDFIVVNNNHFLYFAYNMKNPTKEYPQFNKIRMLREGIGLSQEYVAEKLNITQQAYSKMEKNPQNATLERLQQLSDVLGLKINSIFGDDNMHIQQNFHQQGGNATSVMYNTSLADRERDCLLQQISNLQQHVDVLTKIIDSKL